MASVVSLAFVGQNCIGSHVITRTKDCAGRRISLDVGSVCVCVCALKTSEHSVKQPCCNQKMPSTLSVSLDPAHSPQKTNNGSDAEGWCYIAWWPFGRWIIKCPHIQNHARRAALQEDCNGGQTSFLESQLTLFRWAAAVTSEYWASSRTHAPFILAERGVQPDAFDHRTIWNPMRSLEHFPESLANKKVLCQTEISQRERVS